MRGGAATKLSNLENENGFVSRRGALSFFSAIPLFMSSTYSASASLARHWEITGVRVKKLDGLDEAMSVFMRRFAVRSGSLAVARRGVIVFNRAYTFAEPGYTVAQPTSRFRLASLSKAFTAALIYELVQAGLVSLDSCAFPLLGLDHPALPSQQPDPRLKNITVQHLLEHRAGWDAKVGNFDPIFSMRDIARRLGLRVGPSRWDIARFMIGEPLQFAPGAEECYSNFGYLMLGLVAEKVARPDFFGLMKQRVTDPLGIENVFAARTHREQRLAEEVVYDQLGTGLTPEFPERDVLMPLPYGGEGWLTESMIPGGGLVATSSAVVRMIGHYAVWGYGPRSASQMLLRIGGMAGTSSLASSRPDGLDFCLIINTHLLGGAQDPISAISKEIHQCLDTFRNV
jgi:CubicO group peptidase (beta-lactamase class C family)